MEKENVYLKPKEISDLLRVSIMTVNRMLRNGEIESIKVGEQYRIPKEAFDRYIVSASTIASKVGDRNG